MKFINLYFEENHAHGYGGGLYVDDIKLNENDVFKSFELNNLTFVNNYADKYGGI